MTETATIPVIDIFAGPGGLGEGFSAFEDLAEHCPFRIGLSIEKDEFARETLRLRSFFRHFPRGHAPKLYYDALRRKFPLSELPDRLKEKSPELWQQWKAADLEAMHAELGASVETHKAVAKRVDRAIGGKRKPWILIGGPPCQAYSILGRVRNLGKSEYRIEDDHRSSLYREYLKIIADHWPAAFVMENVIGLLSATVQNQKVFDRIIRDLQSPKSAFGNRNVGRSERYRVVPLVRPAKPLRSGAIRPKEFVVECERYGIPQERHRVILVGIREDLGDAELPGLACAPAPTVREVIGDLPKLRSGLSRSRVGDRYMYLQDSPDLWLETIISQTVRQTPENERRWLKMLGNGKDPTVYEEIVKTVCSLELPVCDRGDEFVECSLPPALPHSIRSWLIDERLGGACNHRTRIHMDSDLARYIFASCHAKVYGESPKLDRFPADLQPAHENAATGNFDDRFRVQVAGRPSTTVTSHLSKDGHYFIHPDPAQCRSLTVREVARLQTFPDNYFFCGPRTAQYVQVGNAVPPLLARQIAGCIWNLLVKSGKAG
jgi:DNA (cytosine-5)-methyltransferase 1